jgi:hypothetical protein
MIITVVTRIHGALEIRTSEKKTFITAKDDAEEMRENLMNVIEELEYFIEDTDE